MKRKIILFNVLDIFFAIIVPLIFIIVRYDLIAYKEKYTVTGWGLIAILVVVFVLVRRVQLWLKISDDTGIRNMPISYVLPPVILMLFFILLKIAEAHMETLLELSLWSAISNTFALLFRWLSWRIIDKQALEKRNTHART